MQDINHEINRRILIIDDTPAIHNDLKSIFAGNEDSDELRTATAALFGKIAQKNPPIRYEVDSAMQGKEGLAKVVEAVKREHPYAVAFVDMRMPPGWDGIETIKRLWQEDPELEVVICTAYSDYSWSEIIEQLGYSDKLLILKKPFDTAEISQLAAALSEKRRLEDQARLKMAELERMVDDRTVALQKANGKLRAKVENGRENECRLENEHTELTSTRAELQLKNRDLEQAIKELKRAQVMMLHAEKMASIGQLAAGLAHEINTPIQFVGDNVRACSEMFNEVGKIIAVYRTLLNLLEQDGLYAELVARSREVEVEVDIEYILQDGPQACSQSLTGVEQVRKIVQAMKNFSHINKSGSRVEFDLNTALESTITVARNEWSSVADIETDFADLPPVEGLPDELNQAFLNVLINAAHAIREKKIEEKGTISIRTWREYGWVIVSIADTGCGIPESNRRKIFDPFFTTKDVGQGIGQGLAISYNIVVERHQGRIELETEEGVGTTFHVWLPMKLDAIDTNQQHNNTTRFLQCADDEVSHGVENGSELFAVKEVTELQL